MDGTNILRDSVKQGSHGLGKKLGLLTSVWLHLPVSIKDQQSMRQACQDQITFKAFQNLH